MKTLVVLFAFAAVAFSVPALRDNRLTTWKQNIPQNFIREKKSTIEDGVSDPTVISDQHEEDQTLSRTFHKHHGGIHKSPVVHQPIYSSPHSHGYHYRDSEKQVQVEQLEKKCDAKDDCKEKSAEKITDATIPNANKIDNIHEKSSNIEENLSKSDVSRMSQWKSTIENIQKTNEDSKVVPSSHIHKKFNFADESHIKGKAEDENLEVGTVKHVTEHKEISDVIVSTEPLNMEHNFMLQSQNNMQPQERGWQARLHNAGSKDQHKTWQSKTVMDNTMAKSSVIENVNIGQNPENHLRLHPMARGAYGAPAQNYGSYGSVGSYGSSKGSPAVGLFPNANIGGCAVPLLLSCSPSVVSGSIAKYQAPSYPTPAYRMNKEKMNIVKRNTVEIPDVKIGKLLPPQQL